MSGNSYVIVVIEAGTGRRRRIVVHEDNIPAGTEFSMVGGFPQLRDRDRFETLAGNVTDTVLNLADNPAEVSIRDNGPEQY